MLAAMTTFVLLRGWAREARHWGDFTRQLAEAIPGARVATPDLPGAGARNADESPKHIRGYVDALRTALGDDGIAPPYHLVGVSMGGMVAIEWARRYPAEIAAAALINTSALRFSWPHERLRPSIWGTVMHISRLRDDAVARERAVLGMVSNLHASDEALARTWAGYADERPISLHNAMRQLGAAATFHAPRKPPPVRWLVLCSTADRMVNPCCSHRLARAWNVALREHPTAGHELTVDDGPWVARQIAEAFAASGG